MTVWFFFILKLKYSWLIDTILTEKSTLNYGNAIYNIFHLSCFALFHLRSFRQSQLKVIFFSLRKKIKTQFPSKIHLSAIFFYFSPGECVFFLSCVTFDVYFKNILL